MKKLVGILALMAAGSSSAAQQDTAGATREAVAYWTSGYAGPERVDMRCVAPQLASVPRTSMAERKALKAIQAWKDCRRDLMGALAPEAVGKTIPAEQFAAMAPAEREAAIGHVSAVHAQLAAAFQADADRAIAAQQAWQKERRGRLDRAADLLDAERGRSVMDPDTVRRNELARRP
ncbi:hypothetical protein [Massilia sp. X63]|uniref:hypothetical protein n=1 Tax=Massilia sp. X63 TaxID=3237285 RepID=UPI0034DD9701